MKEFEILVSTYNSKLFNNYAQVQQLKTLNHLVIDQSPISEEYLDLNVIPLEGCGLTKSRNLALDRSTAKICLISDDDLAYVDNIKEIITDAFKQNPDVSVITFQIETPIGKPYKNYKKQTFTHTTRSMISTSSVEIAFKREDIINNNIRFNENFGVNAKFPCGEEAIFLKDCKNKGLKVIYIPLVVCVHPEESSGKDFGGKGYLLAKGAMIKKLYGASGFVMIFAYILKNFKKILTSKANVFELFKGFLMVK